MAGRNKTPSGRHLFFLFSSNLVLSWRHLVPLELNFILNLELSESESENEVAQSCPTLRPHGL